jgi:hypothetical protein
MSFTERPVQFLTDGGIFGFALPATHKARWKTCRLTFEQLPAPAPAPAAEILPPIEEGVPTTAIAAVETNANPLIVSSTIKILFINKGKQNESGIVIDLMVQLPEGMVNFRNVHWASMFRILGSQSERALNYNSHSEGQQ